MRLEGWMKDGLMSNDAFINNADSNDPLGVLLEAPLGAYRRLKNYGLRFFLWAISFLFRDLFDLFNFSGQLIILYSG